MIPDALSSHLYKTSHHTNLVPWPVKYRMPVWIHHSHVRTPACNCGCNTNTVILTFFKSCSSRLWVPLSTTLYKESYTVTSSFAPPILDATTQWLPAWITWIKGPWHSKSMYVHVVVGSHLVIVEVDFNPYISISQYSHDTHFIWRAEGVFQLFQCQRLLHGSNECTELPSHLVLNLWNTVLVL